MSKQISNIHEFATRFSPMGRLAKKHGFDVAGGVLEMFEPEKEEPDYPRSSPVKYSTTAAARRARRRPGGGRGDEQKRGRSRTLISTRDTLG